MKNVIEISKTQVMMTFVATCVETTAPSLLVGQAAEHRAGEGVAAVLRKQDLLVQYFIPRGILFADVGREIVDIQNKYVFLQTNLNGNIC